MDVQTDLLLDRCGPLSSTPCFRLPLWAMRR